MGPNTSQYIHHHHHHHHNHHATHWAFLIRWQSKPAVFLLMTRSYFYSIEAQVMSADIRFGFLLERVTTTGNADTHQTVLRPDLVNTLDMVRFTKVQTGYLNWNRKYSQVQCLNNISDIFLNNSFKMLISAFNTHSNMDISVIKGQFKCR